MNRRTGEGWAEAMRRLSERSFDFVLTNCEMPEPIGRTEGSKRVTHLTPIVALTANALVADREHAVRGNRRLVEAAPNSLGSDC